MCVNTWLAIEGVLNPNRDPNGAKRKKVTGDG